MRLALLDLGLGPELATKFAFDPRADDGHRMILLGPSCVTIKRRLRGVKMHLSVPVDHYLGVVIARESLPDGAVYRVSLAHRDPDLSVTLKESRSRAAMIAAWRHWSSYFGVPLSSDRGLSREAPANSVASPHPRQIKAHSCRARRILAMRKGHRSGGPAAVHRGEREITGTD